MENINAEQTQTSLQKKSKINFYLLMNISLLFVLPALSILFEYLKQTEVVNWQLAAKWFIFWSVGIRLFIAGIKQASDPVFTATKIFHFSSAEAHIVIRELGFANISLGVMGILSIINNEWRILTAISAGIFFGLAAVQHSFKKPVSKNEWIALIYDYAVFLIIALYLASVFIH